MLRLSAAVAFTLLSACKQEPDFDARYKAAQQRVDAKASAIDKELAAAQTNSAAATGLESGPKAQASSAGN